MARTSMASRGESINHFNGIKLRVTGSGNLIVNVYSLDDTGDDATNVPVEVLVPYAMSANTKREPTLLANTREQRASFEFAVEEINEYFEIGRIVPFFKALFSQFPGRG